MASPKPPPSSRMRRAVARAPSRSPRPSSSPMRLCAAMARLSSTSARNIQSCSAIWCAAMRSVPMRVATAAAVRKAICIARVRAIRSRPTTSCARIAGHAAAAARRSRSSARRKSARCDGLRQHVGDRGAGDAHVEPVDQERRRGRAGGVRAQQVHERPAHLLDAAHPALAGQRDEDERCAERGDAQPLHGGVLRSLVVARDEPAGRLGDELEGEGEHDAEQHGDPRGLHADADRIVAPARAEQPRRARRRPVGQEVAEPGDVREQRAADRDAGELLRAEVADDRGVDQHVQRLRGERAQRRQRPGRGCGGRTRGRPSAGGYETAPDRRSSRDVYPRMRRRSRRGAVSTTAPLPFA